MNSTPAFNIGASTSTFTPLKLNRSVQKCTQKVRPSVAHPPATIRMEEKEGFFRNPFKAAPKKDDAEFVIMSPQPGDPGYIPPAPVAKGEGLPKTEEKPKAKPTTAKTDAPADTKKVAQKAAGGTGTSQKLPVIAGQATAAAKRGLDLLREDLLKNAPERAGVGRQDQPSVTMKPAAGEPGYKPQAFQTVKVSELGISPFPDDKNAVGKVGGVDAVKKAALDVKKGKTAKEVKKELLQIKTKEEPKVFDIPDYLKPIPEDTPRKGYTWKNYVGR